MGHRVRLDRCHRHHERCVQIYRSHRSIWLGRGRPAALAATCVIALLFSAVIASLAAWNRSKTKPVSANVSSDAQPARDPEQEFFSAISGPAHTELELFIAEYLAPACWNQIAIQERILELTGSSDAVTKLAIEALVKREEEKREALALVRAFGLSPLPSKTNGEIIHCIAIMENDGYKSLCQRGKLLAQEVGDKCRSDNAIGYATAIWKISHDKMENKYNDIKKENQS